MNRWPWIIAVILAIVAVGQQVKVGQLSDTNASLEQAISQAKATSVKVQASLDAATASATTANEAAVSAASAATQAIGALEQSLAEATSKLAAKEAALEAATASLSEAEMTASRARTAASDARAATSDAQAATDAARTAAQEAAAKAQENAAEFGDLKQQLTAKEAEVQKINAALEASRAAEKLASVAKVEAEHIAKATADAVQPAAVGAEDQTPRWVPPVAGPVAATLGRTVCTDCHTSE